MNAQALPYVPPTPAPWSKACQCCKRVHGQAAWAALPFVGYQPDPECPTLELRNCLCGSTISVLVGDRHD